MTLISSCRHHVSNELSLLSDTLLTRDTINEGASLRGVIWPTGVHSLEGFNEIGLAQKAQVVDKRMVFLWAGRSIDALVVGRCLAKNKERILDDGSEETCLSAIAREYSPSDLKETAFLFLYASGTKGQQRGYRLESINCNETTLNTFHTISAGTGEGLVSSFTELEILPEQECDFPDNPLHFHLQSILKLVLAQAFDPEDLWHYFRTGGWSELTSINNEGMIEKHTYAINIFETLVDSIRYSHSIRGAYLNDLLVVLRHSASFVMGDGQNLEFFPVMPLIRTPRMMEDPVRSFTFEDMFAEAPFSINIGIMQDDNSGGVEVQALIIDDDLFKFEGAGSKGQIVFNDSAVKRLADSWLSNKRD
jgi:hypothetical protein